MVMQKTQTRRKYFPVRLVPSLEGFVIQESNQEWTEVIPSCKTGCHNHIFSPVSRNQILKLLKAGWQAELSCLWYLHHMLETFPYILPWTFSSIVAYINNSLTLSSNDYRIRPLPLLLDRWKLSLLPIHYPFLNKIVMTLHEISTFAIASLALETGNWNIVQKFYRQTSHICSMHLCRDCLSWILMGGLPLFFDA